MRYRTYLLNVFIGKQMHLASLLRSFGLFLLAISATIYITSSLSSQINSALLAYFSWFISITVISLVSSFLTFNSPRFSMSYELILLSFVFLIFGWPSVIFSLPSIEQNYITHTRSEPILQSYEIFGKIVPLEEHGSFSLHYLVLYLLKIIAYDYSMKNSFLIYINFVAVFLISLSASIYLRRISGSISAAILMMAFLANMASPAQLERGLPMVMAIFWIILLWFFSNRNRKKEDNFLSILIAISLVNSNMLVLIFLSVFLILLLANEFLFSVIRNIRIKREPSFINVVLPSLGLWIAKIIYDTYSFLYFQGYIGGAERMLQGLHSFFSMPPYRSVGGSIQSPVQLPQTIQYAVKSLRLFSFLCFMIISVFSTFYTFYVFWKRRNQNSFDFSDSLLLFYLISLGLTTLFYIATLSPIEFWDQFGIFLFYHFTSSLLLALAVIFKDLIKRVVEKNSSRYRIKIVLFFLLFVSLISLLQIAIYPSGGSLNLVEFRTYGQYYYHKKHLILFLRHASSGVSVKVLDDSILAQNIEMFSKIGSLPHLNVEKDYFPSGLKTYQISRLQKEGNVVYNCVQYQIILIEKIILCKL